jgi:adenine-specific DNA-methyltransferase
LKIEDLTKEELIDLVKSYEAKKKFGLVWDDEKTKESLVDIGRSYFPILNEIKSKRVFTSGNSQNNYLIEGDNYFVLNSLLFTHAGKIDVIYIDPPYNTGNKDFKYNDSFVLKEDSYRHSKWLNFISRRLYQAKDLLKDDGVIFISIDDNEMAQLRILCDEIYGEKNFIACFVWEKKRKASNLDSRVRGITEYVLAYGKTNARPIIHPFDVVEEEKPYPFYNSGNTRSTLKFPAGITFSSLEDGTYPPGEFKAKKTLVKLLDKVTIKNSVSTSSFRLEGEWRYSQKWLDKAIVDLEEIVFKGYEFKPYWINKDPERSKKMKTLLNFENYKIGTNEDGNDELFSLLGENDCKIILSA